MALIEERCRRAVDGHVHGHATGLVPHIDGRGQKLVGFPLPRLGLHVLDAALVDALLEALQLPECVDIDRIARGHALHGVAGVLVAGRAGLAFLALHGRPQDLAAVDHQHGRVLEVVVLDGPGLRRGVGIAAAAVVHLIGAPILVGGRDRRKDHTGHERRAGGRNHSQTSLIHDRPPVM
jgi:hypothetical protein